jgi:SAM-dependent methyltransferase
MERTEWKPLIPKAKVGLYGSESEKVYPLIKQYLNGVIYDIGCGTHKITPEAIGLDGRSLDGVDIVKHGFDNYEQLQKGSADVVFSSHVLEHILDDFDAIDEWSNLIKVGGYLILYLPDGRYYNNYENEEHIRDYDYESFMMFFERAFCGKSKTFNGEHNPTYFEIVESGLDVGEDKYSFYLVAKKL